VRAGLAPPPMVLAVAAVQVQSLFIAGAIVLH